MSAPETTRRWNGQTREERIADRRLRFIEAATSIYGRQGFHGTGVRTICQAAGLTERYFYESFENSEALLLAVFEHVTQSMVDRVRSADDPTKAPEDRAGRMLTAYYSGLKAYPEGARVFLVEIVGISSAIDAAFERSLRVLLNPLLELFDSEGQGPLTRLPLLRRGVAGGLLHIAIEWGQNNYRQPVEEVVSSALPLCFLARSENKLS